MIDKNEVIRLWHIARVALLNTQAVLSVARIQDADADARTTDGPEVLIIRREREIAAEESDLNDIL